MKKNKIMRLASGLLVAVLLTTCAISGTFAKYVTTGSGTDTARVAKWGVYVDATGVTAFEDEYGATVKADTADEKIVAPGTDGEFGKFVINGQPEVSTRVTYDASVTLTGWTVGTDFYCPIWIYVNGVKVDTSACTTAAQYSEAVSAAVKAVSATFDPNTAINTNALTVEWYWPFSTGDANDAKDTILGNQNATDKNTNKISVTINVTITQVD